MGSVGVASPSMPPENELQKSGCERTMSEHQLRVQRSLQKLNVPDWYKKYPEGFLLKRSNEMHWPGLASKATSLSSLGSAHLAAPRSPTSNLLSPSVSSTPPVYMRWSTSRLNSGSTSPSPSGSARSSFSYRRPYLGWRSQERVSHPRTPAERLAAGLQQQQQQHHHHQQHHQQMQPPTVTDTDAASEKVPNLSEVQSSIKEVTSAIVHYVSGVKDGPNENLKQSPRGVGRLCWLESSFVGSRPLDSPQTPLLLTSTKTFGSDSDTVVHADELYLDLNSGLESQQLNATQHP